jgi:hypothetical protein
VKRSLAVLYSLGGILQCSTVRLEQMYYKSLYYTCLKRNELILVYMLHSIRLGPSGMQLIKLLSGTLYCIGGSPGRCMIF